MKVLVLGAAGTAGHVIALYLKENGWVVDTLSAKNRLDRNTYFINVMNQAKFAKFLDSKKYDAIVNCIGLLVKQSQERKDLAVYLNSYLPHFLEFYYTNTSTKIIHLSTDRILPNLKNDKSKTMAYEDETYYDRTKSLGEIINDKDLTFRMSIIGPDMRKTGGGLFNWFWNQTGEISGYNKVLWSGVTTVELAKAVRAAIEQNLTGIYNLTSKNNISKFNLLRLLKEVFNRSDITIKPDDNIILDRTLINHSHDFDFTVSDYKAMLGDMKKWIDSHNYLYPHYLKKT